VDRLHRIFNALLRLSEDVARSSHARMVLEMGLVRVATLGPLQPIEELLGRLRDLANRPPPIAGGLAGALPAMAAALPSAPPPAVRDAAPAFTPPVRPRPAATVPPTAPAEAPQSAPPIASGAELIDRIKRGHPLVGGQLGNAVASIEGRRVILRFPAEQGFLIELLRSGSLHEELKKAASNLLGRPVELDISVDPLRKITAPPGKPQETGRSGVMTPTEKERKFAAAQHPAVQEVLRIFDSSNIKDVLFLEAAPLAGTSEEEPSEQE
jgi:DNA polymerase-3 subunit gamma/tau